MAFMRSSCFVLFTFALSVAGAELSPDVMIRANGFGNWGTWSDYCPCSKSCGSGVKTRTRECVSNVASAPCVGVAFETMTCGTRCGEGKCGDLHVSTWGAFGGWGACSKKCGLGETKRTRKCIVGPCGEACVGIDTETKSCGTLKVDGNWGYWTEYSSCSTSCGLGTRVRTRSCNSPPPGVCGEPCAGLETEIKTCGKAEIPLSTFGPWTTWGACSEACGVGFMTRTRHCIKDACGGDCVGQFEETKTCGTPVFNGGWGGWIEGTCSTTCGIGTITRRRYCDNPPPNACGAACDGAASETTTCGKHEPLSTWGAFGIWSACSEVCGVGFMVRTRECIMGPCGDKCVGQFEETKTCGTLVVNGGWGKWTGFSECSNTCGGGLRTRTRACNNPAPSHCGQACDGPVVETRACPNDVIMSSWGAFGSWSACSQSCGEGLTKRTRKCIRPYPICGGDCVGSAVEEKSCGHAIVNGMWTTWTTYSDCSTTCGLGMKRRTRVCGNPAPSHCGSTCKGYASETKQCGEEQNIAVSTWGGWGVWGVCSTICGVGSKKRTRRCNIGVCGGACVGSAMETQSCGEEIVDGIWGKWTAYSECSVKSGIGRMIRTRSCDSPAPNMCGVKCEGPASDAIECGTTRYRCTWGAWAAWDACSKSCGLGSMSRTRVCIKGDHCEGECAGTAKETKTCNEPIVNGNWEQWSGFCHCSVSCGFGRQTRTRRCNSPAPSRCGAPCAGAASDTQSCGSVIAVSTWGLFREWSACTSKCGNGTMTRTRSCRRDKICGERCDGLAVETQSCGIKKVDGQWGPWSGWCSCSTTCGIGQQSRTRRCNNPAPNECGAQCAGISTMTRVCGTKIVSKWSAWMEWGECSKCGQGSKTRTRTCICDNGCEPNCEGSHSETVKCTKIIKHGGWGLWEDWTTCSSSCDVGTQKRRRFCNSPKPNECGSSCVGRDTEVKKCNKLIARYWGGYSVWSKCSKSCGIGTMTKYRVCLGTPVPGCPGCSGGLEKEVSKMSCGCKPVAGNWGAWTEFHQCTTTCGIGTRTRTRVCNNPAPSCCGATCVGVTSETERCGNGSIIVNTWGSWTGWSACSKTCADAQGYGMMRRTRVCIGGPCGVSCVGSDVEVKRCGSSKKNGNWGSWSIYSNCSTTCGHGRQTRTRLCNSPAPNTCGDACAGSATQTRSCGKIIEASWGAFNYWSTCSKTCGKGVMLRARVCMGDQTCGGCAGASTETKSCGVDIVNGGWGGWIEGTCSTTCGIGTITRRRYCNNPAPNACGAACVGATSVTTSCGKPVERAWGSWTGWSSCSETCGSNGKRLRTRVCISGPCGGVCVGSSIEEKQCGAAIVHGHWTNWIEGTCSTTCGIGTITRRRYCTNPSPSACGEACVGAASETTTCGFPVEIAWGSWTGWSGCSKTCGSNGIRIRTRVCISGPCGGVCVGNHKEEKQCGADIVDGGWSVYSAWTTCSSTCGLGTQMRSRTCTMPTPSLCGKPCVGPTTETKSCECENFKIFKNQVKTWGAWGGWGPCSTDCGFGLMRRTRACLGNNDCGGCVGPAEETMKCGSAIVNGNWESWSSWGDCSSKFWPGRQTRYRACNNPAPSHCGDACEGPVSEARSCGIRLVAQECKDGQWTASAWSTCSVSCGFGTQSRGTGCCGGTCKGKKEIRKCGTCEPAACKTCSDCKGVTVPPIIQVPISSSCDWDAWSSCSVTCGTGSQYRIRSCGSQCATECGPVKEVKQCGTCEPAACKSCPECAKKEVVVDPPCVADLATSCKELAAAGVCENPYWRQSMTTWCCKSCGIESAPPSLEEAGRPKRSSPKKLSQRQKVLIEQLMQAESEQWSHRLVQE